MTISFSGLASGLDTSSWVESLVALKQAKVTALQQEKSEVEKTRDKLSSIKSFFSTFRDSIEKITDSKFAISSMDLFSQNLAVSSNLAVLTATAKTEAVEGTYNISVERLAGYSTATSGHSTTRTVEETITADENTKLSKLGVSEGNISVEVGGIERGLVISSNETVGSFVDKLKALGVDAKFDKASGTFTMDVGVADITDTAGTNIVSALHLQGVNEGYSSNVLSKEVTDVTYTTATEGTYLTELGITAGTVSFKANDTVYNLAIDANTKVQDVVTALNANGIETSFNNGVLSIKDAVISSDGGTNFVAGMGLDTRTVNTVTQVSKLLDKAAVTSDTYLTDLGVAEGQYFVYANGVRTTLNVTEFDTVGSFMENLKQYDIEAGLVEEAGSLKIVLKGQGDSYIETSTATNASDLMSVLFPNDKTETYDYSGEVKIRHEATNTIYDSEDTLLSEYNTVDSLAEGKISVTVDGVTSFINVDAQETIGSLVEKFNRLGVKASYEDGKISLQSGQSDFVINTADTTSGVLANLGLTFSADLGGYVASSESCKYTETRTENINGSVAQYADGSTKLSMLNISSGSLAIYRNGEKATIQVNSDETFDQLKTRIAAAFGDVTIDFDNGHLKFSSTSSGVNVEVGSSVDTTNLTSVCGLSSKADGTVVSSRELYNVNGGSKLTTSGLFKLGTVTEGTFTIGDESFEITSDTTLNDIIKQINASENANVSAFWDSVEGKLVLTAKSTGASLINIEAGTSNFTDILGFTTSEWNADGTLSKTKLLSDVQKVGQNALFSINGTSYTSTSNTIESDISRIAGVTINLKGISQGGVTTLKIEKDTATIANAVSDIVDSYNTLLSKLDEVMGANGELKNESTLKMLKSQIRNIMMGSVGTGSVFKNLDSIGISTGEASGNNISTTDINTLKFDKDEFINAYKADPYALQQLLVGTEATPGIFTRVENVIESALTSNYGYFSSAEKSFANQISKLNDKVTKAQKATQRYKERLESKFQSMDMLISKMQNQYSSFLGV